MFKTDNSGPTTRIFFDDVKSGWEQWGLLRSDVHHDSLFCRRKLEKQHLEMAKEHNAFICDFGDTLDAMQGRYDPRRSYDDIRPEYIGDDYYDRIVDDTVRFYTPYKDNFVMFAMGNHETSVRKHAGTNLIKRIAQPLGAQYTEFGGWIRFIFTINKTKKKTLRLRYSHSGGSVNAPVTRGVISTNRQAVWLSRVDIVINGHDHHGWVVPVKREEMNNKGEIGHPILWFGRIPGYQDSWADGTRGYAVEKAGGPRLQGSLWIWFRYDSDLGVTLRLIQEFA